MAVIRFSSAFNMLQAQDWDWVVTEHTATSLVIQDTGAGKKQTFTGSFTYNGLNVSGTCTGTSFFQDGSLVYRVSGMNHDAGAMQDFAETSGDTQQGYAFVLSGNDSVIGSSGKDTLLGYAGNDKLDGGGGADVMLGGAGNDKYVVNDSRDRIFETTTRASGIDAGGTDTVLASASYTLSDFIERLTLTGAAAIDGTGNAMDNLLKGNAAANRLSGAAGSDTLMGGGGDDILVGGAGRDTLTGGAGKDTFDFNAVSESGNSRLTCDTIKDFKRADGDRIDLSTIDANPLVAGNQAFTFVGTEPWGADATGSVRYQVLNAGVLVYGSIDADADPEFAIFLAGVKTLSASDFVL